MIRYFLQGRYGPWYEVTREQLATLGLDPDEEDQSQAQISNRSFPLRAVYVNTSTAVQEDVKTDFPGLQDLIWFPDMRCGDCNGRLIDENAFDPDMKYPRYVHATGMMDRHGAWPVERWED